MVDLATAKTHGIIAGEIDGLTGIIAQLDQMIAEKWRIKSLVGAAPDQGSSLPAGTTIETLPFGPASDELSMLAWTTARKSYQDQIDALNAELDKL